MCVIHHTCKYAKISDICFCRNDKKGPILTDEPSFKTINFLSLLNHRDECLRSSDYEKITYLLI